MSEELCSKVDSMFLENLEEWILEEDKVSLAIFLSIFIFSYLYHVFQLSYHLSIFSFIYLSIYLSFHQFIFPSVYIIYTSVHLLYFFHNLSVYLIFIYLFVISLYMTVQCIFISIKIFRIEAQFRYFCLCNHIFFLGNFYLTTL